ncbi:chemerin-like receptor 1 [Bombina bombina]|uniref:chemerin-like receptor 1 n=1 Tax=Bombina bombina TaxID=8345 RepID=UPI00235A77B4|nr:chemerin-like receptor 1 [Bombina bombina]
MNYTADPENAELRHVVQVVATVTFSFIFILGVMGNGTVIWITGFRLRRTINTVWFLNLALADFISTFLVLVTVLYLSLDLHWPFGPILCKLVNCMFGLSIYTSILLLTAISIDRCVLVLFPVWCQNYRTTRLVSAACIVIWVLSIALVPGSYTLSEMSTERNRSSCKNLDVFEDWERREADIFTVCIFLYQFLVPLSIILISYAILLITLHRKKLNRSSKPFLVVTGVVFSFFLCWLPYHAFALARVCLGSLPLEVSLIGVPLSKCLAMFNSCINPILYVFVGREFKDAVKRSLTQVFKAAFEEQ